MKRVPAQRGVTLVELLVTMVLVGIFFAAAVPLFVFAQKQSSGDRARVVAANVAQSELEAMRSISYAELVEGEEDYTWPNDLGGPIKVYKVKRTTTFVHQNPADATSPVLYTMVTVDVWWKGPPTPVKHVVLTTAIYPQYRGPEILKMKVSPLTLVSTDPAVYWILDLPVTVSVRVNPVDLSQTDHLRIGVTAANGSYSDYVDIPAENATTVDGEDGWFTWSWDGARAGDGEYTFTAVAITPNNKLGEPWQLTYMLDTGPPQSPTLLEVRGGDGVVRVHWAPPTPVAGDLDHYVITCSDGRSFTSPGSANTTFMDRGVTNGTAYTYTVVAVDERDLASVPSDEDLSDTAGVQSDISDPAAPASLAATIVGQSVTLSWPKSTSPDVAAYYLYRGPEDYSGMNWPIAVIPVATGQTTYSYVDPRIGWGASHTYYVRAVDGALNESTPTASTSVTSAVAPPEDTFGLTVKVAGQYDAIVMVASLVDGSVYDITGARIVDDKSVNPIFVKPNQKQGVTFRSLPYSDYRVTVVFVDNRREPISGPISRDVELVRNETVTFAF